jgi:hypothetical protein
MDKIRVSIQFRKYLYTCPCGEELLVDDNTRTYNCAKCGFKLGEGWYKDVGDCLSYSKAEYDLLTKEDIEVEKGKRIEARIIQVKTPIPVYEPTKEDLEKEQVNIDEQIASLQNRKSEIASEYLWRGFCVGQEPIEEI